MNRTAALVIAILPGLLGCAPVIQQYYRLDFAGGEHSSQGCGDERPSELSFQYHGIGFELVLDPESMGGRLLSIDVSEGHTVQLLTETLLIVWNSPTGPVESRVRLSLIIGNEVRLGIKESPTSVLHGKTYRLKGTFGVPYSSNKSFTFVAIPGQLEPQSEQGTIHLPALLIDGAEVPGPVVTFRRASHASITFFCAV